MNFTLLSFHSVLTSVVLVAVLDGVKHVACVSFLSVEVLVAEVDIVTAPTPVNVWAALDQFASHEVSLYFIYQHYHAPINTIRSYLSAMHDGSISRMLRNEISLSDFNIHNTRKLFPRNFFL